MANTKECWVHINGQIVFIVPGCVFHSLQMCMFHLKNIQILTVHTIYTWTHAHIQSCLYLYPNIHMYTHRFRLYNALSIHTVLNVLLILSPEGRFQANYNAVREDIVSYLYGMLLKMLTIGPFIFFLLVCKPQNPSNLDLVI